MKPRSTRLHVAASDDELEAGYIITYSLLLSHGVRADTSVAVLYRGRTWILVEGRSVRRLWPDADTVKGWVRAVLRGNKRLGAKLARHGEWEPPLRGVLCVNPEKPLNGDPDPLSQSRIAVYNPVELGAACKYEAGGGVPLPFTPAVINILWDRLEEGLPPAPSC